MLLRKRARPPMKRTTSMKEITVDPSNNVEMIIPHPHPQPSDHNNNFLLFNGGPLRATDGLDHRFLAPTVSPRSHRRNSADFMETPHFLRHCFLCNRSLIPGHDIYMYRGDSAFCSLECRQQQIIQDERKEKCSLASKKETASTSTPSQVSANGETVTAV